jgi:putative ATP-dependent endonuclease of OLD family
MKVEFSAARLKDVNLDPDDTRKFNFHIRRARGELLFARCWILGEGETDATLIPESAIVMKMDLERAGIRFVTYQTGISLEPCLRVANGMGIHWVVLADNDAQGVKDHEVVRKYLNGRQEKDALFVMPEQNIEQYLCVNGFSDVYFNLLSEQPRQKVTAQPQEPSYPIQVADALPRKLKTHAAQQVLAAIRNDPRPVPTLFRDVIEAALKLAEAQ